jgi:hypothetical protein
MNVEYGNTRPCPLVAHHAVEANGAIRTPACLPVRAATEPTGRTDAPKLVIVSGPLCSKRAQERALRIVQEQTQQALMIAVCTFEWNTGVPSTDDLQRLHGGYHAVLAVQDAECEQLIERLIRIIVTPDCSEQYIASDWNDIRHIISSHGRELARFGSGCDDGPRRAATATLDAIAKIERDGPQLRRAHGICIGVHSLSTPIYGKEIREVLRRVSAIAATGATITLCVGRSLTVAPGGIEVDLFAFGERSPAQLAAGTIGHGAGNPIDPAAFTWSGEDAALDPLYPHACSLVVREQRASISLIQRHLRIGYGRASRLLAAMEGDAIFIADDDGLRRILVQNRTL